MVAASVMGLQADKDLYNKVVKGDIAEFNEFMKQQNSYDR